MDKPESQIITFYSYKGGVGRTMGLANVAWLLAMEYDKKVLVVDWDLEAPGLHRFFKLEERDIKAGLVDLLYDYKDLLRQETASLPEKVIDIKKYLKRLDHIGGKGSLSILSAGRQDKEYAKRVNEFRWEEFYAKWYGFRFIEEIKKQLKDEAEIVLVDSRTGLTDIGGICTLQLPDVVVLLFALNEQNISGTEFIIQSILEKTPEVEDRKKPPKLILRPARVEITGGQDMKIEWEAKAAKRLGRYLPEEEEVLKFIKQNNIPYIGDYSYGETPLAVEKDPLGVLAKSFGDLTISVLKASGHWDQGIEEKKTKEPSDDFGFKAAAEAYRRGMHIRASWYFTKALFLLVLSISFGLILLGVALGIIGAIFAWLRSLF